MKVLRGQAVLRDRRVESSDHVLRLRLAQLLGMRLQGLDLAGELGIGLRHVHLWMELEKPGLGRVFRIA